MNTKQKFWSFLAQFLYNEKYFTQTLYRNQNTRVMFGKSQRKSCILCEKGGNAAETGKTTDDNMAHAYCMMDI